jgi:hypothetical protein
LSGSETAELIPNGHATPHIRRIQQRACHASATEGVNRDKAKRALRPGTYSGRVEPPSSSYRQVQTNRVQLGVPDNWREFRAETSVTYVPEGAYGEKGLTHGILFGTEQAASSNLRQATQQYLESLLQGNPYLRQQTVPARPCWRPIGTGNSSGRKVACHDAPS